MSQTWMVACFALSVDSVDGLIEAVGQGLTKQPRWIVFSDDMPKLGALATYWEPFTDVVVVMFSGMSPQVIEAAESVLAAELAGPCSTIWVQPPLQVSSCPPAISRCVIWESQTTEELAHHIVATLLNP